MSEKVILICEACLSRNYVKNKNKTATEQKRLSMKKFCKNCNKHTLHKETR